MTKRIDIQAAAKDPGFAAYFWSDANLPGPSDITGDVRAYLSAVAQLIEQEPRFGEALSRLTDQVG